MLTKIIQPRPYLVFLGTVICSAPEAPICAILRSYLMHAFLMSFQIVLSTKSNLPVAVGFLALKRPRVPKHMLSERAR